MPVKIRLQRHGRKGQPFYHIVVADSRSPRDGKFIEKLGTYNPLTDPATIDLNVDKAIEWLHNGAQPSDTARSILSYKGALYKKHLQGGIKKGVLTAEQAEEKLTSWQQIKDKKIGDKKSSLLSKTELDVKERLAKESKIKDEKMKIASAKKLAAQQSAAAVDEQDASSENAPQAESVSE